MSRTALSAFVTCAIVPLVVSVLPSQQSFFAIDSSARLVRKDDFILDDRKQDPTARDSAARDKILTDIANQDIITWDPPLNVKDQPTSKDLLVNSKAQPTSYDVRLCIPVFSAARLRDLRESWLNDALANPNINVKVFVPANANFDYVAAGSNLKLASLPDWQGDVSTLQVAMIKAMGPCLSDGTTARFTAVLDDDVVVDTQALLSWTRGLAPDQAKVYGRQADRSDLLWGGCLLMPESFVQQIVSQFDAMVSYVSDEVRKRQMLCYQGAPFMIEEFFTLAMAKLGGSLVPVKEVAEATTMPRPLKLPLPAGVVAVHHVESDAFREFANSRRGQTPVALSSKLASLIVRREQTTSPLVPVPC